MKRFRLGCTQETLPAVGLGCMGFGGYYETITSDDARAVDTLLFAFEIGYEFLDTAEIYGMGHSEELIGEALRLFSGNRPFIATKVSPRNLSPVKLIQSVEASLDRLGVEVIDLYQVHWPNPKVSFDESMGALSRLAEQGKLRHIGLSNYSLKQLRETVDSLPRGTVATLQTEYNISDRSAEAELLPYCKDQNITVIAYSPLDQGGICREPEHRARIQAVADKYGCTIAQLTLCWLIKHGGVIVIPKSTLRDHLLQNLAASDFRMTEGDITLISRLTEPNLVDVAIERIRVTKDATGRQKVYTNLDEATLNIYNHTPSPVELADEILKTGMPKRVKVCPTSDSSGRFDYDLVEGRSRYWAWVIAHNGKCDIPVLVLPQAGQKLPIET